MKKFTSAAIAAIILAMTLSGCGDTKNVSNNSSTEESTVNESTSTTSTTSTESTTESTSSTNESTPTENSDSEDDPNAGADNSGLAYPDTKAGRIVKAMLSESPWAYMDLMDAEIAKTLIPDFSADDCDEYCLAFCGMNAQLQYAFAVKPKSGSEEKVNNALTAFLDNVKNNPDIAFYPMQEASANGAVMNTTDDGYICLIVHENGQAIADAVENVQ